MQSDKERIEQIIQSKKLSNIEFCNRTNLSPSTLSHILSERTKPTLSILRNIVDAFPDLNPLWIMMGQGEMTMDAQNAATVGYSANDGSSAVPNGTTPAVEDDIDDIFGPMKNGLGYTPKAKPTSSSRPQNAVQSADSFIHNQVINPSNASQSAAQIDVDKMVDKVVDEVVSKTAARLQKPQRKVTEVRIFFDDGTYECFMAN